MNDRERHIIELQERNEKNKVYHRRRTIYYIGMIVPLIVIWLLVGLFKGTENGTMTQGYVMIALLALFALWCIFGLNLLRCPHCSGFLNRVPRDVHCCPHCGTILDVYSEFDRSEE